MCEMLTTIRQQPHLAAEIRRLDEEAWPDFLAHDTAALRYWADLFTCFSDFQFALHREDGEILGLGLSIPLYWDGRVEGLPRGWNTALEQGFQDSATGRAPTALCGLSAVVAP